MPAGADQRVAPADRWRLAFPVALGLALLPFAVAIVVSRLDGGHTPISDRALMELKIRDVGVHPVTIGLYSRDAWAHPGPFVDYLLAVPYRLLGSDMNALMVGSLMINGAAIAAMGWIAKRIGGLGAALVVLVAVGAVARAFGMDHLTDPWVCWITVLPFGTFCLLTWAMADGRIWSLPATALVASYLMQTHVGFVPITLPALGIGAVWLVVRIRRTTPERMRTLLVAGAATVGALVVVWFPTFWDEWRGTRNLSVIVRWFRDNTETPHTLGQGVRIVGGQFAILPDWITGTHHLALNGATTLIDQWMVPLLLVPLAVAVVVAFVRRDRIARSLLVMLTVTLVAGVLAVARTNGIMYEYRLLWTWTLGALMTAAAAFALWRWLAPRLPRVTRPALVGVLLLTLLGLTIAETADALDTGRTYSWESPEVAQAVHRAEAHLHRGGGQLLFTSETPVSNWYQQGVVLAFEHAGFDVRVRRDIAEVYGRHRVEDHRRPVQADLLIVANDDLIGFHGRLGYHVIGFGGRRSLAATVAAGDRLRRRQSHLQELQRQGRITTTEATRRLLALPLTPVGVLILARNT